tara:strand:+ start:600 stop:776 length:177 start_codon:yes stop_codon:yes gene_type:complete
MNADPQLRISEAVARAKNAMLEAARIAQEQPRSLGIWKKIDKMAGKIEALQRTVWGVK